MGLVSTPLSKHCIKASGNLCPNELTGFFPGSHLFSHLNWSQFLKQSCFFDKVRILNGLHPKRLQCLPFIMFRTEAERSGNTLVTVQLMLLFRENVSVIKNKIGFIISRHLLVWQHTVFQGNYFIFILRVRWQWIEISQVTDDQNCIF